MKLREKYDNDLVRLKESVRAMGQSVQNALRDAVATLTSHDAARARRVIENENVDLHDDRVIYDLIDDVKKAMSGLLKAEVRQEIIGMAEVRSVFQHPKFGAIAGCMVTEGVVKRSAPIHVLRDNVVIYEGELDSLRRFKDDVSEVKQGLECGICVKNYQDVREGDQIEVFENVEVKRTLD